MVSVCRDSPSLCFRGTCDNTAGQTLCRCEPGFTSDLTLFWMNDCSMPDYWYNVLGGVCIVGAALIIAYGLHISRPGNVKGSMKKVLNRVVAMQWFSIGAGVAVIVQQRVTPTFFLFMAFGTLLMTWSASTLMGEFLHVSSHSLNVEVPHAGVLRTTLLLFPVMGSGPFFVGAFGGYATQADPAQYNLVICAMLLLSPVFQLTAGPVLLLSINALIKVVQTVKRNRPETAAASPAVEQQDRLLLHLISFRNAAALSILAYLVTTPVLAIIYLQLGSLPYSWVITLVLATLNQQAAVNFFIFMRRQAKSSAPPSRSPPGGGPAAAGEELGTASSSVQKQSMVVAAATADEEA
jgi:hypothetical protein